MVFGGARSSVSEYVGNVYTFVSSRRDIEFVLKALKRHEKVTRAKINRVKTCG